VLRSAFDRKDKGKRTNDYSKCHGIELGFIFFFLTCRNLRFFL